MHRLLPLPLLLGAALGCGPSSGSNLDDGATTTTDDETGEPTTHDAPEPECVDNSDCPLYSFCDAGMCVSGEQPDEEECYDDLDCPDGVCVEYHCVPALPQLDTCDPIQLTGTQLFALQGPLAFDVGDVDGQPGDDIVAYHQGEIVSVVAGVPTISPHPVPYGGIRDAVLLQADADGNSDLIVAGATGSSGLRIFLGSGDGNFSYLGARYFDFEIYRIDRAAASVTDALLARSSGSDRNQYVFLDPLANAPTIAYPNDGEPLRGDVDGDGIDEIGFLIYEGVELWLREGDSYVATKLVDCHLDDLYGTTRALIQDVDADGLDDVVCITEGDQITAATLWTSLGELEFSRQPTVRVEVAVTSIAGEASAVADLQGDGNPELVFPGGGFLRVGEDGNFACESSLAIVGEVKAGDLDADGRDELVQVDHNDVLWSHAAM